MTEAQAGADLQPLPEIDPLIHAPARLRVMTYLFVVEEADFIFLKNMSDLTWGNLSTHLSKLEKAGYVEIAKGYQGKKPHTMIRLSRQGRSAFQAYRETMKQVLENLPDEAA